MKKKSKWMWISAVVIIVGGGAWFLFGRNNSKDIEYRFDEVKTGDISIVVTATGTLQAVTTVQVGSQVSGTVAKLYADFNTVVKSGDVVAQLDPTFLDASVKESQANLERATAQMNDNKRTLDRSTELIKKGLISQAEYDAAKTTCDASVASVKQSQATLDRAQVNLKFATIRAPIDGVVISRNVDVGQTVAASFSAPTLFVIANDLSKMQVQASIDEADIGRINLGQNVSFTVDAYPDERFRGRVAEIRLQPNNVQNVINYTVVIDVPNPDLKLMPGMTANVTILVDRKNNVLRIPNLALRFIPPDLPEEEKKKLQPQKEKSAAEIDTSKQTPISKHEKPDASTAQREKQPAQKQQASSEQRKNLFEGMTREQMMEKFRTMSPEEKQKMRDQFAAQSGGMMGQGGGQWREGKGPDFKAFDRQSMLAAKNPDESGKQPKLLTEKWKRTVETYQRKEFPGHVWVMDKDKKLKLIPLRLGITDGIFTEIISGDLNEGNRVIVGSIVKNDTPAAQANPFSGQPQRQPMGGRRGF